ncbi:hypothetical protein TKK_0011125 [Trichogramma kaykai]|uniref:Ribosomal RNA-processing protein 8 n=1 Tax=Trichogramma kaykai TaxID=54128 RepID=A0ABD2WTJ5_9HYME
MKVKKRMNTGPANKNQNTEKRKDYRKKNAEKKKEKNQSVVNKKEENQSVVNKKNNKNLSVTKMKASQKIDNNPKIMNRKKQREFWNLPLRERMMSHLKASRFRFINEQLYTNDSNANKKLFQEDPSAFYAYHEGYKNQVEKWPMNPVDVIIKSLLKMPKEHVIADFGCGEAKIAESVPQTVHSFDLVAVNEKVKACDIANTPLLTGRTNVVVFCLSLMGSNLNDYILEANRVLIQGGILKIAEVESRFEKIEDFIHQMKSYGFVNTWKDLSHNIFYFMDFKKTKDVSKTDAKKLPNLSLKSCMYKKR